MKMAYIPEKYEKYDLLPESKKDGIEVFSYPDLRDIEEYLPEEESLIPYGYQSIEDYMADFEKAMAKYARDEDGKKVFEDYKRQFLEKNRKKDWSVLKYIGPALKEAPELTPGQVYFWPTSRENPVYEGVIDDEEFSSYMYSVDEAYWEILEDPTGMAERTMRKDRR